jgi:tetratricopeptide (TPR) repeat protein
MQARRPMPLRLPPHVILWTALLIGSTGIHASFQGQAASQQASANASAQDTPDAHVGQGYDALKQDRYDVAVSEFRAALQIDPTLTLRARFPLAVALFEQHKFADARKEFEIIHREVGDHPNVLYYLGRLDLEDRNFDSAVKLFSKAAAQPPFPDTAYYLGFAYFKKGDLANAQQWLKQAAQETPRDARVPYQLSLVYRQAGREEEARAALELSQELRRRDDHASRLRTECGQKLDQSPGGQAPSADARALCDQLYDPDDAEALTALGMIYGQHKYFDDALRYFQRAADLDPQAPQMQYNLALTYFQLNRLEQARAPLAAALQRWPDLFPLNALYGSVLARMGETQKAHQALAHAHQLNPQDIGTTDLLYATALDLAHRDRQGRHYSTALDYLVEAAKIKPAQAQPHREMAEIYKLTNRPALAEAQQKEADRLAAGSTN